MSPKRIQRKNPWQPNPAPDILQSRPFSNGKGPRESKLPSTSDILQTRPFSPRDKDVSKPEDTRSFEEKMQGAEFRYNGVSIPAVQREEVAEENSQEQAEGGTSAANISVFAPSMSPPPENSIVSPFSLRQTGGWGQEETIQREEEVEEQREVGIQKQQLQAPPDDGIVQRLCDECEGELAEKEEKTPVQAKLTVGEAGDKYEQEADAVAAQVVSKINAPQVVQQNPQSSNSIIQREEFGEQVRFDSLAESPPRARLLGPYSDRAIAEELYGDPSISIIHTPQDYSIIQISYGRLLDRWKPYFSEYLQEEASSQISLPIDGAEIYVLEVNDEGNPLTGLGSTQSGRESTVLDSALTGLRPGATTGGAQSLSYLLAPPIRSRLDPLLPLMSRTGDISSPLGRQGSHFLLERYGGRGSQLLDELVPRYRGREGSALRMLEYSYRPGMPLSPSDAELLGLLTRSGLSTRDLESIPQLLARAESGGFSSLSAAEQQLLQSAVRAHAEFGQVAGSPFISATRQGSLSGMQGTGTTPTFLRGRQYIVRIRVPASAVADANALVPRGQTHHLAHELEMLVATDARGAIQSVRPNPTSSIGRAAPWLRVGGRVLLVAGVAYSGYRIGSATPEERPRVIGEEAGGQIGGWGGAALGAGACIAFGIASGGLGLLACGLGGALLGGGIGSAIGGEIGEAAGR